MTTEEVSEILNVSTRTVRRLADARGIPGARKIGFVWRFDRKRFAHWFFELRSPETESTEVRSTKAV